MTTSVLGSVLTHAYVRSLATAAQETLELLDRST
jgi:hypothetical protein